MRGQPLPLAVRQVLAVAARRRRALGYRLGRAPRALSSAECTTLLAKAVIASATWHAFGAARLLGTPPASAERQVAWHRARRFAMFLARRVNVPDAVSAQLGGWSEQDIRDAVASIQDHPQRLHDAGQMWQSPAPKWTVGATAHPLLADAARLHRESQAAADHAIAARAELERLEQIRADLSTERIQLIQEIEHRKAFLLKVERALTALGVLSPASHKAIRRGRRNQDLIAIVHRHPKGISSKAVARIAGADHRLVNIALCGYAHAQTPAIRRVGRGIYGPVALSGGGEDGKARGQGVGQRGGGAPGAIPSHRKPLARTGAPGGAHRERRKRPAGV